MILFMTIKQTERGTGGGGGAFFQNVQKHQKRMGHFQTLMKWGIHKKTVVSFNKLLIKKVGCFYIVK